MVRRALCLLLCLGAAPALAEELVPATGAPICEADLRARLTWLAADERRGRDAVSPEADAAAEWIARAFGRMGLRPQGVDGDWFQPFVIRTPVLGAHNELRITVGGDERVHEVGREWNPFSVSPAARAEGEVVFAGYGIHAPEHGYSDYDGLDVRGRVVLVLRKNPGWKEVQHASFVRKLQAAHERGAAALLLCNDPATTGAGPDRIGHWSAGLGAPAASGPIPYAFVAQDVARRLLAAAGATLEGLERDLRTQGPRSFALPGVRVALRTDLAASEAANARNVLGFLPGRDPDHADEVLVLGAHYDHVGLGWFGSTGGAAASGQVHNGADDNGSGTAALIELAEWFAEPAHRPRRSLLFIAFSGEERGLLGSAHYVEHPTVPLADTVAMLNLDMVGRCRGGRLEVGGVGTAEGLQALVVAANEPHGLTLSFDPGGEAPSDSTSFFRKGLPVLFFFTGLHPDYHRPTDVVERIEFDALCRITHLVRDVAVRLADADERPRFTRPPAPPRPPVLGVQPSPEPDSRGVALRGVVPGGPAAEAGIEPGDVLVSVAGQIVRDLDSLRAALGRLAPGKTVAVEVLRGEERVVLKVTLGEPRRG